MLNEVLRLTKGEIKTTTKIKIDNCMFCGSENVAVIANLSSDKMETVKNWYVECRKCFARGSEADSQNDAIAYWNRQPQYLEKNLTPNLFEQ
ncbi:MAG: Lar family restriction alleviation protein [Aliarcobacter butzleri]|nr:Lar family restriction alleviation protein [Aliarcobacter butzleri]